MTGGQVLSWAVKALVLAATVGAIAGWTTLEGYIRDLGSTEWLVGMISNAGPFLVVLLMVIAIVASPIPSGPIAFAAGAVYGTVNGGMLVWAGAVLGALAAFTLSRTLGYRPLQASAMPAADWLTRPRSQTMLALLVLISRLVPFISFDAVSYIAGLTSISAWRFVVATAIGVLPTCFGFAAMGAGTKGVEVNWILAVAICMITVLPPAAMVLWRFARLGAPK